ncbi:MAG TPA: LuxR C-terminal-related transcriptional regulator [Solirubrobacterales bacterium]|nr:LuxR C-terminal-related transcriptional regulator [Solirubrobacterales bacterium]
MSEVADRPLGSMVERRRLLEKAAGAGTAVVLVQAPAGYGKSVLLRQWEASDARPFASILLGPAHDDPAVLLAALIEALAPIEALPSSISSPLRAPQPNVEVIARRLEEWFAKREIDSVLALDEVEHLRSPTSLRILEALVAGANSSCQVALASRERNLPGAARLLASRRLTVIEASDLTMTPGEAREMLGATGIGEVGGAELDGLMTKTEGWPAALYLAALSLRDQPGESDRVAGFAGDDRDVVDYIRDEFLASAPEADIEILIRISLLDRFCGDLCDAILERRDSAVRLIELARSNTLLIPLDRRDEWFRMHSLLGDMLRSELRRRHPGEVADLNRRASTWWQKHDDIERAVGFALDAEDLDRAGELIWEAVPTYMPNGRYATLEKWVLAAGAERIGDDPHLSLTIAHSHLAAGRGADAEHWANLTRELLVDRVDVGDSVSAGLAMIDATLARDGVASMAKAAASGTEAVAGGSPWTSMAHMLEGIAAQLGGDPERARELIADAARRAASHGVTIIQVIALGQLALLDAAEEDWQSAVILTSQARAQIDRAAIAGHPTVALPLALSAYVRAGEQRNEDAIADLRSARALLDQLDRFGDWYVASTCAALAAAATGLGDGPLAGAHLVQARAHLARVPDAPMLDSWVADIEVAVEQMTREGGSDLTPAELRVLRLLPTHLSLPQIATELVVSPNTVKTQAQAAYRKLGVSSRREAVDRARAAGLLDGPGRRPDPAGSARP